MTTESHDHDARTTAASLFRRLHDGPELLLLPNCWDAGSARLVTAAGARAVATTSAGVAWANGYPDGNALPLERLVATIRAIARVVSVPLTVDTEGGYSNDPAAVGETVAAVVNAGAVGINLEDGNDPPALLAAKIASAKRAASRAGVDLFVNARVDVYLRGLVPEPQRVGETVARARMYREAGADGIFAAKIVDAAQIREVAASVGLPLNVLAWPGLPSHATLQELGVRRLSAGSAIAQVACGRTSALATAFLRGESAPLFDGAAPFGDVNALFAR